MIKDICKICGRTREEHPYFNPLTGRWSKKDIPGQHRLRKLKYMCKKFTLSQEEVKKWNYYKFWF